MPPRGQPYGRTALPTSVVDDAEYVSLAQRMSQDIMSLGATHRTEQDAQSLAQITLPEPSITGTTGYESMLQPEQEQPTEFSAGDPAGQAFGDTSRRTGLMAMPESPSLPTITPRRMAPEQGQSFELPGTEAAAPVSVTAQPGSATAPAPAAIAPAPGAARLRTSSGDLDPAALRSLPRPAVDPSQGGDAVLRQLAPSFLAVEQAGGPSARNLGALVLAENGGGQSPLSAKDNNYFSITHVPERGFQAGPGTGGRFARYESPNESLADFVDLIKNSPRYQEAWALRNAPPEQFFGALARAGYIVPEPGFPVERWLQNTAAGADRYDRAAAGAVPAAVPGLGGPSVTQRASEERAASGERPGLVGITPPQFGLGDADADAICGPVLAMAFAKSNGRNPTIAEAKQMAATHGRWTSAEGMGGPEAMATTLRQMGIPAHYAPGGLDIETIRRETQNGNPVGINTRGHYFVVEGVDADGRLDLGNSAKALRASGGRQWFRPQEIEGLGMGAPTGAIYKDAPSSPTPSVAVSETRMPAVAHPEARQAMAPEQRMEHDAMSLAALSDPSTGAEDVDGVDVPALEGLRLAHVRGGSSSDIPLGMPQTAPAGPPARDDYRNETIQPYDPDAGPREALPGSVGAQPYLGPMSTEPELVTPPPQPAAAPQPFYQPVLDAASGAVSAVQDAYAVPAEQRPPQYSGPSYSQPTREQAGQPPVEPWEPIQNIGTTIADAAAASVEAADRALTGPTLPPPTWEDPLAPVRAVGQHVLQEPLSVLPAAVYGEIQGAGADVIGRRAGAAAGLSDVKEPYQTPLGTFDLSQQDVAGLAAQIGLDPMNLVGVPATAKAHGLVRALVEAVPGIGELLAVGDIATAGIRAARARVGPAIGRALAENAQRTAAADARMAAEGSTAAPGVFGLSGIEPENPLVQGMRPRIIPPDVADTLDFPIRLPEDPRVLRAIEAAGGTVDERGVTLNVIRNQGPEAAGGTATRGMTYHIAGPPGTPNPFSGGGDIGGTVRFEGPTRFRNPLFISQESGGKGYLDDALEQLGVTVPARPEEVATVQRWLDGAREQLENARRGGSPDDVRRIEGIVRGHERDLLDLQQPRPVAGRREIDEQVNAIRRSTAQGSPERVAALQELVQRYGGTPGEIPDLVARRVGETESGYAIVENIIAANARAKQHDGVIYLGKGETDYSAVSNHPAVIAAAQAEDRAIAAATRTGDAHTQRYQQAIYEELGLRPGETPEALRARIGAQPHDVLEAARERAGRRPDVVKALDEWSAAEEARVGATEATRSAQRAAEAEFSPHRIEELADTRELLNPTPGAPNTERVERARQALETAQDREADLQRALDAEFRRQAPGAMPSAEWDRLARERNVANREVYRLYDELTAAQSAPPSPPGYTLRPDIPRHGVSTEQRLGQARATLAQAQREYSAAVKAGTGQQAALDAVVRAKEEVDALTALAPPTRGPGSEIAQASAGALQAGARSDPLAAVNRALSQGVVSSVSGGVGAQVNQELNPDDPYAGIKGFAAGALVPPLLARGAGRLARAAGAVPTAGGGALASAGGLPGPLPTRRGPAPPAAAPGLLSRFPGVQGAIQASQQRQAAMQARGLTRPSGWDWAKQFGYSGIFGPATASGQVIGGALELGLAQEKEAVRVLTTAQGGRYSKQVAAQVRALPEAFTGLVDVVLGRGGSAGAAARSGGSQGTAKLSERVVHPLGYAAARVLEKSGELWAEAPDAIFRPIFTAQGMQREADVIARELGYTGSRADSYADTLMQEARRLRSAPGTATSPQAQRVVDAGKAYADELGYKGDAGKAADSLSKLAQRDDAVGLAAAYLVPFPGMAGRTTRAALRATPGVGLLPGVRAGRPLLGFDTLHDQAVGAVALAGFGAYAANGGITGSGPADPEQRRAMIAEGWQPNAMLVGDHYVPNRLFQRFGPILNAVGEAHDIVAYGKKDEPWSAQVSDAGKRVANLVTDQTGLSGLSDMYDLFLGQGGIASAAPGTVGRAITRYTPFGGTIRAGAQMTDPEGVARKPDTWAQREREHEPGIAGSAAAFAEAVGQQLEQNIPANPLTPDRGDVPVAQDLFGRPLPNPQQGLGAVIPRTTTLRDEPIVRIYQDADVLPSSPKTELRVTSSASVPPIPLMPAEQRLWNEKRGEVLLAAGQTILSDPNWAGAPLEARQKALKGIMDQAAKAADGQVLQAIGNDEITRRVNQAVTRKAG